jgi:hypothetical protein
MRRITRSSLGRLAAVVLGAFLPLLLTANAQAAGGSVTISPAAATISLPKGQGTVSTRFTATNNYSADIVLHFAFEQLVATPGAAGSALKQLSVASTDLPIAAGASAQQTITLTDSPSLAPGSQQVELVISQLATAGHNVGITPSIRMPLIVIKQDGAVSNLSAGRVGKPALAWLLPKSLTMQLTNSGNVISVPRGYVTIADPRGNIVSKGIINSASAALSPGSQAQLSTPTASLDRAWLPGLYRVSVVYGLGGGQATKTATARFVYVPAWEVSILVTAIILAFAAWQLSQELLVQQRFKRTPRPPAARSKPPRPKTAKHKRKIL